MTPDARPSLTTVEKAALLLEVDLFHDVPSDALAELAARMEEGVHEAGDVLLEPGAPDVRLWVLLQGRVRVTREADVLTEHGAGDAVGLLVLLGVVDDESVIVIESCRTLSVTPEDYLDALADSPAFALANLRALGRRLRTCEGGGPGAASSGRTP